MIECSVHLVWLLNHLMQISQIANYQTTNVLSVFSSSCCCLPYPPLPHLIHGHPEFTPPSMERSFTSYVIFWHTSSIYTPGKFLPSFLGTNCENLCSDKSFIYGALCFPWIITSIREFGFFFFTVSCVLIIMTARKN